MLLVSRLMVALTLTLSACNTAYSGVIPMSGMTDKERAYNLKSYKVGNVYTVLGQRYTPKENWRYSEVGQASWYGPNFHRKPTANGEKFNKHSFTAAHRTLPMPSIVKVTNLENGKQVKVRVNDRGPFAKNRIIDLSKAAADKIGMIDQGTARVRVEVDLEATAALFYPAGQAREAWIMARKAHGQQPYLTAYKEKDSFLKRKKPSGLAIQFGAFLNKDNALKHARDVAMHVPSEVEEVISGGGAYYRVYGGRYNDEEQAEAMLETIKEQGFDNAILVER